MAAGLVSRGPRSPAEEPAAVAEPARRTASRVAAEIDEIVRRADAAAEPAPRCDDATFVRRVHLDFAGRIPTPAETTSFLADESPDRRSVLIDRLLAGPEYPVRMRDLFHAMLMERRGDDADWSRFLETSFR